MALIGLFFQTKAVIGRPSGLATGGLELDASVNETHEATATVTQSEVEDGSNVNDHVTLLPKKLTLEGVVSKTPLGIAGLIGSVGTAVAGAAAQASTSKAMAAAITTGTASFGGLIANSIGGAREPADVYDFLVELRDRRLPFDVVTALKLYQNMVLTSLSVPRNIQNTGVLRFTAVMEQVKIVSSSVVSLSSIPGAAAAQNLGKQATSAASSKTGAGASILYNIFKGGG